MFHFLFRFIRGDVSALRAKAAPSGYIFLRNYKAIHRSRLERTIALASLQGNVIIVNTAFDASGQVLPAKVSVYTTSNAVEALFFQFYAQVKADEKAKGHFTAAAVSS